MNNVLMDTHFQTQMQFTQRPNIYYKDESVGSLTVKQSFRIVSDEIFVDLVYTGLLKDLPERNRLK